MRALRALSRLLRSVQTLCLTPFSFNVLPFFRALSQIAPVTQAVFTRAAAKSFSRKATAPRKQLLILQQVDEERKNENDSAESTAIKIEVKPANQYTRGDTL